MIKINKNPPPKVHILNPISLLKIVYLINAYLEGGFLFIEQNLHYTLRKGPNFLK